MMRKNVWYNDSKIMTYSNNYQPAMCLLFIYFILFLSAPVLADESRSALDSAPSVDVSAKGTPAAALPAAASTAASTAAAMDKADNANAADSEDVPAVKPEAQESYVYDLKKLIIKSRENIKRVNDKIKEQAVIKRNQKREERAREYYQRGLQLQEEGKLDEAREYFEKAVRITEHPEMTKYIQQSEFKLKAQDAALRREEREKLHQQEVARNTRQQEAKDAYDEAVRLYRQKKFKEAKDQFEHVEELSADYKATRSYLKIIDQDIIRQEAAAQKQQSKEMERQQQEAEVARQREKEAWKQEIDRKEKERAEQVNKQAQDVYEEAVALYKGKKFVESKKKFQEVEWVLPDYKATHNYLTRIDKDIAQQEKDVAEQKAKALAQQQWEEEVAKRKKEAEEKREALEKERIQRKQLEDQAGLLYQAAVTLYDKKNYDESLEKFNDIDKTVPGFKSTRVYIAKINQLKDRQKQEAERAAKRKIEEEARQKQEAELAAKRKADEEARQKQRQLEEETAHVYNAAVELFNHRQYEESKNKFIEVNGKLANFKRTGFYLKKIDELLAKAKAASASVPAAAPVAEKPVPTRVPTPVPAKTPVPVPAPKPMLSVEDQKQEARDIEELAQKAATMYQQITALSQDRRMVPAKRKMAQVDQVLNNLKAQKEAILRQIKADEERQRQQELAQQREAARRQAQQDYDDAIMLLRNKQFDEAKTKFQNLESNVPNFKSTRQYLSHIDQDKEKAEREAVLERTLDEQKRLAALEAKRRAEEEAQRKAEQERRQKLREAQEAEIQNLAEKAAILNDEILNASQQKDFKTAKLKFDELDKTLASLQAIKQNIADDEAKQRMREEDARRAMEEKQKAKELEAKAEEEKRRFKEDQVRREKERVEAAQKAIEQAPQEAKRQQLIQEQDAKQLREKEMRRHQEDVYRQAVDLYEQHKYAAAKVIFDDLALQNYGDAKSYVRKIQVIMQKGELALKAKAEQERTRFIAEEVRKQRLVNIMQQRERAHQAQLTKELEHQKKLAEDARQQDRMRLETLRMQIKERQRMEYQQRQAQRAKQKADEEYHFRKIAPQREEAPKAEKKEEVKPIPVVKEIPAVEEINKEDSVKKEDGVKKTEDANKAETVKKEEEQKKEITAKERKEQIALSNKRKKFLMEKYRKEQQEQREKELRAKREHKPTDEEIKADKEKREKLLAEEKEKREKMLAQEKERKAKEEEKLKEMERKRQEELAKQKQEEEERRKAEIARREELRKKQEELAKARAERLRLDREARERQRKLEEERKAIRQRLMEGVKDMYQDALRIYKNGDYTAAAIKFQDIEDLVPDYKQTRDYLIKSRRQSLQPQLPPAAVVSPVVPAAPIPVVHAPVQVPVQPVAVSSSSEKLTARDQAIQKTLDVFDSNAR